MPLLTATLSLLQVFPLSPGPRGQSSSARPVALALQQALGQELAQVRQGSSEVTGISVRLLQAVATLLNSPHGGALVMAMHRSHFLACPLMRQLCQYQVGAASVPAHRASAGQAPGEMGLWAVPTPRYGESLPSERGGSGGFSAWSCRLHSVSFPHSFDLLVFV